MRKTISLVLAVLMMLVLIPFGKLNSAVADDAAVTDTLVASEFTATNTTYTDFSGVKFTSDAVYAGQSAITADGSIQLRSKNSNSGIVTTASGGNVRKVKVTWDAATSDAGDRQLDVYGKATAYADATNLYADDTQGTLLGSIVCGTDTELDITDDYAYIGMRSKNGAMYLVNI